MATNLHPISRLRPQLRAHSPTPSGRKLNLLGLLQKRKSLAGKDWKGIHHNWGGLLLGLGVLIAVVGPANTYIRLGKLFPGTSQAPARQPCTA